MKRSLCCLALFVTLAGAFAQTTDAPPEHEHPFAPDSMPPIDAPPPKAKGKLQVEFAGTAGFPERRLRTEIARPIKTIEDYGLDEANAYDAAFFLESFYRKNGYSKAEVASSIVGPWQLRLTVTEGPLAHVGTITVEGNKAYDTPTLTNYLLGPTRERFPRVRKDILLPYVESDIWSGTDLVRRLYAADGYLDAVVDTPVITVNADGTSADISLKVTEGIQYRFGDIRFEGTPVFSREELLTVVAEGTKNVFTEGRMAVAQRSLEDFYKKRGYFQAQVTVSGDPATAKDGLVPIAFGIQPGAVFHFDGVTVTGTDKVKPTFVQKRLGKLQGKTYSPQALDKKFRTLIETGLFRNVHITPQAVPGDQVHLDVSVEEAKTKEFGIGLGYASFYGGIISASYVDRNIFRSGRPFNFNIEVNQRGYNGEAIYSDPWFLDSDFGLKLRAYALTNRLKGYSKNEIGFQPTLSRPINEHLTLSAFLLGKQVGINNIEFDETSLVGPTNYSAFSLGITQTLDYRNNITLPTRGFIFTTSLEIAPNGISDVSFVRGLARFSYYIPVTAKSTLSLGARAGIISSLNGLLPIDERFFNGGATSVRSFSELTLGPKGKPGYPLGGEGVTVFNVEYDFPLYGDLYGAVFVDAGNVVSDAANFGVENMRYALGAGLRYNLPIGAIRLDYGLNPDPKPGEAQGAFHFAIGVAF